MNEQDKRRQVSQDKEMEADLINPASLNSAHSSTDLNHLTLHEERAKIEVIREQAGAVSIRKIVKERQEVLPVTLVSEVLEITVKDGAGKVTLNGEVLEPGRTYEVLVYDERATVQKQVYAVSDVDLTKQTRTFTHNEEVTLRREELEVLDPQGLVRDVKVDGS